MMPIKTSYFESEVGAENFKNFIEKELIPHIDITYRTTKEKLLCGQSLSAIFTLYHFLTSQETFNAYIICSGGFLDREDYFVDLTKEMLKIKQENVRKIFLTHGLTDFLDPEGMMREQLENFNKMLESDKKFISNLKIYEEEGHVPYQSLYHGLKFIYE
jgi:predicted alpha/beta superfamily hydrolase